MKLSDLIASRPLILRQAALAHTAAAWSTLQHLSDRIASAGLRGTVHLSQGDPAGESPLPVLASDELRPSVLEEHFTEDDVFALAEALAFATDTDRLDLTFALQTLGETYAPALQQALEKAGVVLDVGTTTLPKD